MLKRGIFILCLLVFAVNTYSQVHVSHEVLVPLASVKSTNTHCISQTVGEAVVQYISSDYIDLTQGFQQPSSKGFGFSADKGNGVKVYPNPVQTILTVKLFGDLSREYRIVLFGFNGSIYMENTYHCMGIYQRMIPLDLSDYSRGTYFVKVVSSDGSIQRLFKIEKL